MELPGVSPQVDALKQVETAIEGLLHLTWQCVIANISVRSTKELMRQHDKLLALNDNKAYIQVPSLSILNITQKKLPDIEVAFKKAFGITIIVSLIECKKTN